jgi:hypothetical protein
MGHIYIDKKCIIVNRRWAIFGINEPPDTLTFNLKRLVEINMSSSNELIWIAG